MSNEKHTILFTLVYTGEEYSVQTCRGQYHSLMTLISDHVGAIGFGLCSGMGSCGTCMVEIKEKYSSARRSGLSCEMQVNDELANTFIIIPDKIY